MFESWIETSELEKSNNSLEKVMTKGFDFPAKGMKFPTGHL